MIAECELSNELSKVNDIGANWVNIAGWTFCTCVAPYMLRERKDVEGWRDRIR